MAQSKKIKHVNYIIIDGVKKKMADLSKDEQDNIAIRLNDTAMRAIGYVREDKTA